LLHVPLVRCIHCTAAAYLADLSAGCYKHDRVLQRLVYLCIVLLEAESGLEELINLCPYGVDPFPTSSIFDSRSMIPVCALPSRHSADARSSGLTRSTSFREWHINGTNSDLVQASMRSVLSVSTGHVIKKLHGLCVFHSASSKPFIAPRAKFTPSRSRLVTYRFPRPGTAARSSEHTRGSSTRPSRCSIRRSDRASRCAEFGLAQLSNASRFVPAS
jgi:hypothetical protein